MIGIHRIGLLAAAAQTAAKPSERENPIEWDTRPRTQDSPRLPARRSIEVTNERRVMVLRKLLLLVALAATALSLAATAGAATRVTTTATFTVTRTPLGPPRFADGNVFRDLLACGTASLANGGSWTFCQTVTLVLHPDGTFTVDGDGTLTGFFPGCGDASTAYEFNGHGTINPDGSLVGPDHFQSIDAATGSGGFSLSGFATIEDERGTVTYAC